MTSRKPADRRLDSVLTRSTFSMARYGSPEYTDASFRVRANRGNNDESMAFPHEPWNFGVFQLVILIATLAGPSSLEVIADGYLGRYQTSDRETDFRAATQPRSVDKGPFDGARCR